VTLLAVDVGLANGFAVLSDAGDLLIASEFPILGEGANRRLGLAKLGELITQFHVDRAVVEDAFPMPKQGVSSVFRYARAAGSIEGAVTALQLPVTFVRPAVWKRNLGVNAGKAGMRALACQAWPQHQHLFERVKDEHRAEAALLGLWHLRATSNVRQV
jgi:crossover junction endodeoxyribonuclease RuvC